MYVTWLIVSTEWHGWFMYVTWLIVSIYVTWLIHICDVTNCVYICDTTRSHMWRDSLYLYMARPHTYMCTTHITYFYFYPKCFQHAQETKKRTHAQDLIFILNVSDTHRGKKNHTRRIYFDPTCFRHAQDFEESANLFTSLTENNTYIQEAITCYRMLCMSLFLI